MIAEVIYRQLEGLNIELYSRLFEGSGLNEELYMPNELTVSICILGFQQPNVDIKF